MNLTLNRSSGRLARQPEIISRGFMLSEGAGPVLAVLSERISTVVSRSDGNLQADIEDLVKSYIFTETKRRPTIFVTVSREG